MVSPVWGRHRGAQHEEPGTAAPGTTAERPAAPGGSRAGLGQRGPALLLGAALLVSLGVLVSQARLMWFFGDDWAFLVGRRLDTGLLEPHNEHWSTLPLVTYRVMLRLFGIDHYLVWALMPIALHLAAGLLLHRLLRRHGVAPWAAVLAVLPLVLLAGAGAEDPLWTFQIGFLGSVVLGLVALLARPTGVTGPVLASVATVASLACSGIGVMMAGWLGLHLLLTHGWRRALLITVSPGLVYVLWYLTAGRGATGAAESDLRPDLAIEFTWVGLSTVWSRLVPVPGAGAILLVLLVGTVALHPAAAAHAGRRLALAGIVAATGMYALISLSRSSLGPEAAGASRYAYVALVMMTPALAVLLQVAAQWIPTGRAKTWLVAVGVAVVAITGIAQTVGFRLDRQQASGTFKVEVTAAAAFLRQPGPPPVFPGAALNATYNPDLTLTSLLQPGVLARFPHAESTPEELLEGSLLTQAAVSSSDLDLPAATDLGTLRGRSLGGGGIEPFTGCTTLTVPEPIGAVDLRPSSTGSQVVFVPSQAGVQLQMVDEDRAMTEVRVITTTPGVPVWVGSVSRRNTLRIILPPGPAEFCSGLEP